MLKFFFNHAFGFKIFFIAIETGLNVKFYGLWTYHSNNKG